jgi:hypothetical protein
MNMYIYTHICLYIHLCVYVSNDSNQFEFKFEFGFESPYRAGPPDEQEGPVLEDVHAAPVVGLSNQQARHTEVEQDTAQGRAIGEGLDDRKGEPEETTTG